MKVGFAGTPEFAVPSLQALIDSKHEVVAVWTQPDRPAGRGKKMQASPIKLLAQQHELPVHQPVSLRDQAAQAVLKQADLDCLVVAAYGLILPQIALDTPRLGCINVHASLLPRWRGAAPVQAAILAGDAQSGVTIMQMAAGLDTGDMLLKHELDIGGCVTAGELTQQLADCGAGALLEVCADLPYWQSQAAVQVDEDATYAGKITKQQALVDWQLSAFDIARQVRAFSPWPVAYTVLEGERLRIWSGEFEAGTAVAAEPGAVIDADKRRILVAAGEGSYAIHEVQMPGKRRMPVSDFINAYPAFQSGASGLRFG